MNNLMNQPTPLDLFKTAERSIHYINRSITHKNTAVEGHYDFLCYHAYKAVYHLLEGYLLYQEQPLRQPTENLSILLTAAARIYPSLITLKKAVICLRQYTLYTDFTKLRVTQKDFREAVKALRQIAIYPPLLIARHTFSQEGKYLMSNINQH